MVRDQAATYKTAMDTTHHAATDLSHVASSALPAAWRRAAAETASAFVHGFSRHGYPRRVPGRP